MNKYLLVINAGSSSIKFAIYQKDNSTIQLVADAAGQIEAIGSQAHFTVKTPDGVVWSIVPSLLTKSTITPALSPSSSHG